MGNFSDLLKYYKDCLFEDSSDAIFAEVINNQTTYWMRRLNWFFVTFGDGYPC
jgi:hypothetical protein